MKPIRFITGYANYKMQQISRDGGLSAEEKTEKIRKIDQAVRYYESGALSVDEAINVINAQ